MPGTFFRMSGRFWMPTRVLHHQDHEDLALGIERPDVGAIVIILLAEPPVAHRLGRAVAAHAGGLVERRGLQARIAAGGDRVIGLVDGRDVRPHDAVDAEIERLLGLQLRLLGAIRRNPHHRRDAGRDRAGSGDLAAVEHVLQAIAQRPDVPRIVLHLVDDAVVFGGGHRDRGLGIGLAKRRERRLAGLQGADHAV